MIQKWLVFLPAMSSSRSDNVTSLSVCPESFCLVWSIKALDTRYSERVARMFHGCLFEVSRVFESFKDISRKL